MRVYPLSVGGEYVSYHGFVRPKPTPATTEEWLAWLYEQDDVLLRVAPPNPDSCRACLGSSGYRDDGRLWDVCPNCRRYGGAVDVYVPITYSIDAGLESMLHRYKDFDGYRWLRFPLGSLLEEFSSRHAGCINRQAPGRRIDLATVVPSDNVGRPFDHMNDLLSGVVEGDPIRARWNWDLTILARSEGTSRPQRGQCEPSAYEVAPRLADGASVLLLDDTWTSGSSAASAAAALKRAGASHVTVVTLGRQLNVAKNFGSTGQLYDASKNPPWDHDECVICA